MINMRTEVDSDKGFFKQQHVSFRRGLTEKDINNFANLNNDEERFKFVHDLQRNSYTFNVLKNNKSEISAKDFKSQGNKAFQDGAYNVALYFYTKSLLHFPLDTNITDFAITRANRSAALYHLEKYQPALQDIDAAVVEGYPKDLLYKLKDRKARCLLAVKQHKSALQAFKETLVALDDAKLKTEARQKWQRDVQIMISMMSKLPPKDEKVTTKSAQLKYEENKMYPAASSAVGVTWRESTGRYAVAAKNIEIGDILLVEKPHCAVLLQDFAATHCYECLTRVEVGEPCPSCSNVMFCSPRCRARALQSHHGVECRLLPTLWASGLSVTCLLALRAVSRRPLRFFTQLSLKESSGLWEGDKYSGSDYRTFYNLVRHQERRTPEDLLHRANVAVFLHQCLKAGGYFETAAGDEAAEHQIGGLLLRNLQILQFNAHEVAELHVKEKGYVDCVSVFIGGAVYPTLALFNHSCNPAIVRYFKGDQVVARAIRDMKVGETIAENYGPIFTQVEKAERQRALREQYWFECDCEACRQDWPLLDQMDITLLPFRCSSRAPCDRVVSVPMTTVNYMARCAHCGQTTNIIKGLKVLQVTENIFRLGTAYLEEGDCEKALKKFLELYHIVNDVLAPPFKDLHLCQQAVRTCFLAMGNKCTVHRSK